MSLVDKCLGVNTLWSSFVFSVSFLLNELPPPVLPGMSHICIPVPSCHTVIAETLMEVVFWSNKKKNPLRNAAPPRPVCSCSVLSPRVLTPRQKYKEREASREGRKKKSPLRSSLHKQPRATDDRCTLMSSWLASLCLPLPWRQRWPRLPPPHSSAHCFNSLWASARYFFLFYFFCCPVELKPCRAAVCAGVSKLFYNWLLHVRKRMTCTC